MKINKVIVGSRPNLRAGLKSNLQTIIFILSIIIVCLASFLFHKNINSVEKFLNEKGFYSTVETIYKYEIIFSNFFNKKEYLIKKNILAKFYIEQGLYDEALKICSQIPTEKIPDNIKVMTLTNKMIAHYYLKNNNKVREEYAQINNIISKYEEYNMLFFYFPTIFYAEKTIINLYLDEGSFNIAKKKIDNPNYNFTDELIRYYKLVKYYKKAQEIIVDNMYQNVVQFVPFIDSYRQKIIINNYANQMFELAKLYKDNTALIANNFSKDDMSLLPNDKNAVSQAYCDSALILYKKIYSKNHKNVICTQYYCNTLEGKDGFDKTMKSAFIMKKYNDIQKLRNYCIESP